MQAMRGYPRGLARGLPPPLHPLTKGDFALPVEPMTRGFALWTGDRGFAPGDEQDVSLLHHDRCFDSGFDQAAARPWNPSACELKEGV